MGTEGIYKGKHLPMPVQRILEMAERMLPDRQWFLDMTYFDDGDYQATLVSSRGNGVRDVFHYPSVFSTSEEYERDIIEYNVQYAISTRKAAVVSDACVMVSLDDAPLATPPVLEPNEKTLESVKLRNSPM